jgi:hypothetical protein
VYRTLLSEESQAEGGLLRASGEEGLLAELMSTMVQYVDSANEANRLSALQAICSFASASPTALRKVLEQPALLCAWLDVRAMKVGQLQMQVAVELFTHATF